MEYDENVELEVALVKAKAILKDQKADLARLLEETEQKGRTLSRSGLTILEQLSGIY